MAIASRKRLKGKVTKSLIWSFVEKLQLSLYELGKKGWTSNATKSCPWCIAAEEQWSIPYCNNLDISEYREWPNMSSRSRNSPEVELLEESCDCLNVDFSRLTFVAVIFPYSGNKSHIFGGIARSILLRRVKETTGSGQRRRKKE
ncbi:hypothetical protein AVEN_268903-1 [Araneus ventricosus]|uniref:Uncharacterized protein n=1 Tax=Araneus ventricosus TaxID=182803 RepID=A0A4Y2PD54_ARAVE|nr:hypothetical protein AVEN_268903-1 [Araneus ventricosus]